MFVIYQSSEETLVTTRKKEKRMLSEFFAEGIGRKLSNFDRYTTDEIAVWITPKSVLELGDYDKNFKPPYEED